MIIIKYLLIGCSLFSSFFILATELTPEHVTIVGKTPAYLHNQADILPVEWVDPDGSITNQSLANLFTTHPQVGFNGQGGLFQTISIRGLSRWRIQTLLEGVPIHSERRAGNTAEFLPPSMVGASYVMSGAASSAVASSAVASSAVAD